MDAVPGIITTMWFTPTITTTRMKEITGNKDFVYEISCDQMCGKGHYSMRGTVIVETQAEYDAWMAKQQTYYAANTAPATPAEGEAKPEQKTDSVKAIALK
jgi:cytochrome c oxidase subunit 2